MLIAGRSFRTSRLAEMPRWGVEGSTISGELVRGAGSAGRRVVRRTLTKREDDRWQSAGESVAWARVIAFGWQDLEIVNGAPGARRNFIDGFAGRLYATHLASLVRYRQILARRHRLLQQQAHGDDAAARLQPWNEQLAAVGMELMDRRRKAVAALQTELARIYRALSTTRSKVEVRYRTALGEATEPSAPLAAPHRAQRAAPRRGPTPAGPHPADPATQMPHVGARAFP